MMSSKFGIGQQVRHRLSGILGVVIDVDPEYALESPKLEEALNNPALRSSPWYHVVMENDGGETIHTYIAEAQLSGEITHEHPDQPSLDELAETIQRQLMMPRLKH